LSQTYPSGRKVGFDYNLDGDISSIRGTTAAGQNRLYLNGITYNAAGQMTRLRLGNGKWESTEYNDRLQVTEIGLGNSADDKSTLRLEYGYGSITENNGSLRSQKITFAGISQAYEQTYTYDDLNRLESAEEKIGTTTNWKQTFNYDRFGNRTFDAANTTTISVSNTVTNPSASTSRNRLNGYTYDQAGNLTVDAENRRFVYDAENHQTKLLLSANSSGTPDAIYKYDGEGRRVKKISSSETTVFVYDGSGTLVAEYTAWATADPAPTPQVSYLTADHLGSPRVVTNQNGAVIKRTDWMAFGEEVEFNKRASGLGYDQVPETRKGYTGYEKDDESGLDFAQARYYNPKHGRYTSVDPLTASANVKNPQTFNRYSYVLNSPYKFSDPLGLLSVETGACGNRCTNWDGSSGGGMASTYGNNTWEDGPTPESNTDSASEPGGGSTTPDPEASAPAPSTAEGEPGGAPPVLLGENVQLTIVSKPEPAIHNNSEFIENGKPRYYNGFGSILTLKLTDMDGNPIVGAKISEVNRRNDGSNIEIVENRGEVTTGSDGTFRDIVGKGEITDAKGPIFSQEELSELRGLIKRIDLNTETRQTLKISTPDGGYYEFEWNRTLTNRDSKGALRTEQNTNGLNLVLNTTPIKLTFELPPLGKKKN